MKHRSGLTNIHVMYAAVCDVLNMCRGNSGSCHCRNLVIRCFKFVNMAVLLTFRLGPILAAYKCKDLILHTRVIPKVSGLAVWSENCKWYSSLPLDAIVSLFYESV
jgi:hypothetical protein